MPPKPDLSFSGLDDYIYKFKISEIVTSLAKDAPETSTASVEKPKEDRSSVPLIQDWETDNDNDSVFRPEPIPAKIDFVKTGESVKHVKLVDSVKHVNPVKSVKTAEQNEKSKNFSSSPKIDRKDWNGYLKGQPKLGLWYPRDSFFELEAYSNSDYDRANLDRKSTTGGCQFLGKRLISWQCKKQTIVATSTTKVEYVAATNYCGQDLKYVDQHNMVACLERTKENAEFHQIVDCFSTCLINYALTVSPTIYASYIEQFWNTAISKTVNSVKQIHAIVDGKAVVISKSSVRSDLIFNDEDEAPTLSLGRGIHIKVSLLVVAPSISLGSGSQVMSTFTHPIIIPSDSDVEDAFSSTQSPDYTPASPDYFLASSRNTSSSSENGLIPLAISSSHDDSYMHAIQAYNANNNEPLIPPQASTVPLTVLPPSPILSLSPIMSPKRTSTSASPTMTQATIRQLVADSVAAALEAQATTMANTDNTNRSTRPRETPAARKLFSRSNCTGYCKVKFANGTLTEDVWSWWNSYAKPFGIEQADKITWTELKRLLTNKSCPRTEVRKMEDKFYSLVVKGNNLKTYARRFQELETLCPNIVPNNEKLMKVFIGGLPQSIKGTVTALMPQTLK
nr:reverse transcriptase domain-containing protein [Tanacetum cinerariifolium]